VEPCKAWVEEQQNSQISIEPTPDICKPAENQEWARKCFEADLSEVGISAGCYYVHKDRENCCPPTETTKAGASNWEVLRDHASVKRDPHLAFAHGGKADFRGKNNTVYNLLSARNMSVNALFVYDDFVLPRRVVHGSYMSAAYVTLQTWCPSCARQWNTRASRNLTVGFNVTSQVAEVREKGKKLRSLKYGDESVRIGNAHVTMHGRPQMLQITDGKWNVVVTSKSFPNAAANPGKKLLHINLEPVSGYSVESDVNAPHGIIGQSYDGDNVGVSGKLDAYHTAGAEMTTEAQAEGAIEGTADDYQMPSPFATEFKFSRFSTSSAPHRDVSKLSGVKSGAVGKPQVGATTEENMDVPESLKEVASYIEKKIETLTK